MNLSGSLAGIPYWGWGLGAAAVVGGYWWYNASQAAQTAADQSTGIDPTGGLGSIALSPPIAGGDIGGVTTPDASTTSLDALTAAIAAMNPAQNDQAQLAQINAQQQATTLTNEQTVFQSLIQSFNAHQGMKAINADIPGIGLISVYRGKPTVTKTVTKTIKVPTPVKTPPKPAKPITPTPVKPVPKPLPKPVLKTPLRPKAKAKR